MQKVTRIIKGRNVSVTIDLSGLNKGIVNVVKKINSDADDGMGGVLKEFAKEVVDEVLKVYLRTASGSEEMIKRRLKLYGTINPLDGVLGQQLSEFNINREGSNWRVLIGNPTMYNITKDNPLYWQEYGTKGAPMTPYILFWTGGKNPKPVIHPGLPNRDFLLSGANLGFKIIEKRIKSAIKRWIKEQ